VKEPNFGATRSRASILLVSVLLLAICVVSAFTIKLLSGQRTVLDEAIRESQAQAMTLLANDVEQALLGAIRTPFPALKNVPLGADMRPRVEWVRTSLPEVSQILFLDRKMSLARAFPPPSGPRERQLNHWLAQRLVVEGAERKVKPFSVYTFVESMEDRPALFALQPVNDIDQSEGWLLIRFDLGELQKQRVQPLLAEFAKEHGGTVHLADAEADWDETAINWPLNRVLPGWMLVYRPDPREAAQLLGRQQALVLGVAGAVLLAMLMATFFVWRELRRERALLNLRNRFVANVSHELKTPLALIRMYAETLHMGRVGAEERRHAYYRIILREAERLTEMIDRVLDFARLTQGANMYRLAAKDLRGTVERIVEDYRPRVEDRGLRLDLSLESALPAVAHDPHGVTQIVLNLMDNAVKYGDRGGVVEVRLKGDGEWVDLEVVDHGPGIAPRERNHLRKAFHRGTTAGSASGSGLGLALVDQIAQAHHAHLVLDAPDQGSGTRAVVSFPAQRGSA
jgi:signal transduction histidine kinase